MEGFPCDTQNPTQVVEVLEDAHEMHLHRTQILDCRTTSVYVTTDKPKLSSRENSWFTCNRHFLLHLLNKSANHSRVTTIIRKKIIKTMQFIAPVVYNNVNHGVVRA
jgi:hypothetical protein